MNTIVALAVASTSLVVPQCPTEIPAESISVNAPDGWTGFAPTFLRLSGAMVIIGTPNPAPRGEMMGDYQKISEKIADVTYSGLNERNEDKWLSCTYGQYGEIEQATRLPNNVSTCKVRHKINQFGGKDVEITCK